MPHPAGSTRGSTGKMVIRDSASAFRKKILFSILNQYTLIKELGLNIEKYKEQGKGIPSTTTQSLVTFCFCFFVSVISHCEMAFNSFILNQKFILIYSTCKIQKLQRVMR